MSYFKRLTYNFKPYDFKPYHLTIFYSWGMLGSIRGGQLYEHDYKKDQKISSKSMYCIQGLVIYINPFFLGITINKEIIHMIRYLKNQEQIYELL